MKGKAEMKDNKSMLDAVDLTTGTTRMCNMSWAVDILQDLVTNDRHWGYEFVRTTVTKITNRLVDFVNLGDNKSQLSAARAQVDIEGYCDAYFNWIETTELEYTELDLTLYEIAHDMARHAGSVNSKYYPTLVLDMIDHAEDYIRDNDNKCGDPYLVHVKGFLDECRMMLRKCSSPTAIRNRIMDLIEELSDVGKVYALEVPEDADKQDSVLCDNDDAGRALVKYVRLKEAATRRSLDSWLEDNKDNRGGGSPGAAFGVKSAGIGDYYVTPLIEAIIDGSGSDDGTLDHTTCSKNGFDYTSLYEVIREADRDHLEEWLEVFKASSRHGKEMYRLLAYGNLSDHESDILFKKVKHLQAKLVNILLRRPQDPNHRINYLKDIVIGIGNIVVEYKTLAARRLLEDAPKSGDTVNIDVTCHIPLPPQKIDTVLDLGDKDYEDHIEKKLKEALAKYTSQPNTKETGDAIVTDLVEALSCIWGFGDVTPPSTPEPASPLLSGLPVSMPVPEVDELESHFKTIDDTAKSPSVDSADLPNLSESLTVLSSCLDKEELDIFMSDLTNYPDKGLTLEDLAFKYRVALRDKFDCDIDKKGSGVKNNTKYQIKTTVSVNHLETTPTYLRVRYEMQERGKCNMTHDEYMRSVSMGCIAGILLEDVPPKPWYVTMYVSLY